MSKVTYSKVIPFLKSEFIILLFLFISGFCLRFLSTHPNNTIIGFDQARDLSDALYIVENKDLKIIGPTAGNNPNLHHGVLYLYYIIPPILLFHGNPMGVVWWNSFFNVASAIIIYFLAKGLFKSSLVGIISSIIAIFSYQFIQFSGWLSNPSPTIFTVPLFFCGLWKYYQNKQWGLILAALGLGLSIQFELFFIYLIPTTIIIWLLLKFNFPKIKTILFSTVTFIIITSTMILTEFKFQFAGILSILNAGSLVGEEKISFLDNFKRLVSKFFDMFSLNLLPSHLNLGFILATVTLTVLSVELLLNYRNKNKRDSLLFVIIYLLSPFIMLFLGYHNAPWFLIGLPPAITIASGYVISKVKPIILILPIILMIALSNSDAINKSLGQGQLLLEPDSAAILSSQLNAITYTYSSSQGDQFLINSLTNPLYINAIWSYHYSWYSKEKYKYLPIWSGGKQLIPFNKIPEEISGQEKYLFLLIDQTGRIPLSHKLSLINWADEKSKFLEEKTFGGILVQKRELINK